MEAPELVEVKVDSVRVSLLTQHRVIMLREEGAERILPIFIGLWEGDAIAMALEGRQPDRPMTHDLTLRLVETLGAQVQRVVVNKIAENTFYAEITLAEGEQVYQIDARPSDAIALAVRIGAPIYVARTVIDQAGVLLERTSDDSPGHFARVYGSSNFLEPPRRPFFYRTWSYLLALLTGDREAMDIWKEDVSEWANRFPTHEVEWEGRPMLAVHLPNDDPVAQPVSTEAEAQAATSELAAEIDRTAFLLVPAALWEEMSTIARELIEQHRRGVSKYSSRGGTAPAAEQSEQQE